MKKSILFILVLATTVAGCTHGIPADALNLSPESLALKQLQTRRMDGISELDLLSASAGVAQDLGFTIEESEADLGIVVGEKNRSAIEAWQVAGAILLAALGGSSQPIEEKQKIRISIVSRPVSDSSDNSDYFVRVTFQRIVYLTDGKVSRLESVEDAEIYEEFFSRLSKSVFLEVHKI